MAKNAKGVKVRNAVRVARFKVKTVASSEENEGYAEITGRWMALSVEVQRLNNMIWQCWCHWHFSNDSASRLKKWLTEVKEKGKKEAGKCPVDAWPKACYEFIYQRITSEFTTLNIRAVNLHLDVVKKGILSRKATSGSLPGWSAILLSHESSPSFTRPMPVRFDKQNGTILEPVEGSRNFRVKMRLWRIEDSDLQKKPSIADTVELWCGGRSMASQVATLKKIVSGDYKFCGSMLEWSKRDRQWYVLLSYQMPPIKVGNLTDATATLRCANDVPFELELPDGKVFRLSGDGRFVPEVRRRIFLTRRSRASNYRHAHTSSKGHGRARVMNWRWKYQRQWNAFVKRVNHIASKRAVDILTQRGIGNLVYEQPSGDYAESRYLSTAGKDSEWRDGTTWEFFQMGSMLNYKTNRQGINCTVKKVDYSKEETKNQTPEPASV